MSVFTSLGILILSMLILAFLQLSPGIFSLLFHYASGKYSRNKASDLAIFYIFGVETITATIFLIIYFIFCALASFSIDFDLLTIPFCLVLIFYSAFCLLFYFKKSPGTKLFIPRSLAKKFDQKAKSVKNRSDSFVLGAISTVPELFITIPIYCISAIEIMKIGETPLIRATFVILLILSSILQQIIMHFLKHFHFSLADFQKFRTKNKLFFRIFLAFLLFLLAILIFISEGNI